MKCPFRTIETYTKKEEQWQSDLSGSTSAKTLVSKIVPCNAAEAHTKTVDFAECIKSDCPYWDYIGGELGYCIKVGKELS